MSDKDKEKEGLKAIISNMMEVHREQRDEINELKGTNIVLRELVDRQSQLLCRYADLFKPEKDEKASKNYIELCDLLKKYGLQNFSIELMEEVGYMQYKYGEFNNDR